MKRNISQNCLLSLSGQAAARVTHGGRSVLSGVCWSALGVGAASALMQSFQTGGQSHQLNINRTSGGQQGFAFLPHTWDLLPGTCSKSELEMTSLASGWTVYKAHSAAPTPALLAKGC